MASSLYPHIQARVFLLAVCLLGSASLGFATTHFVDVGLNGSAQFVDRDTGRSSFNGQVPTVILVGDTVEWVFHYTHSATSGSCPNGQCVPANPSIFDSGIQPGPPVVFDHTFTQVGTFTYFCQIHLANMQGRVVVLAAPDYTLELVNNSFFNPVPTVSTMVGDTAMLNGNITGFFGYNSLVDLACQNGVPHTPSVCPSTTVPTDGNHTLMPFTFSLSDSVAGDYDFQIVGVGRDPGHSMHSQAARLGVGDFSLTGPAPGSVTLHAGMTSQDIAVVVSSVNFSGFVALDCLGLPQGASCFFPNGNGAFPSQGIPASVTFRITNTSALPGIYPMQISGTASNGTVCGNFIVFNPVMRSQPFTLIIPGLATHLAIAPSVATVTPGTAFDVSVSALDNTNAVATTYTGTVHFTSSDPNVTVVLPADHTFTTGGGQDNGTHIFASGVTLKTLGPRVIRLTDDSSPPISGLSPIILVQPGSTNNSTSVGSSRSPLTPKDAYFKNDDVTFTITVAAPSGSITPTGIVHLFDGSREITPAAGLTLAASPPRSAQATFPIPHLPPGGHMITAVYDGDSNFGASVSTPFSQPRWPAPRCIGDRCPGTH